MAQSNILTLTLMKKWFFMILSGEKKEEYRDKKPYWEKRFKNYFNYVYGPYIKDGIQVFGWHWLNETKEIRFKNGYQKNAPEYIAEVSITENTGRAEWGAESEKEYYVLKIHRITDVKNVLIGNKLNDKKVPQLGAK